MMHPVSWLALGVLSIAAAISSPSAHAVSRGIDRATGQALWNAAVHGKTTTIGGGNGSMKVIRPTGANGTPTAAAGGGATVTDQLRLPVGGIDAPVGAKLDVSKADIAGAVVSCATGGIPGCALAALPLAIGWLSLSGARFDPATGAPQTVPPGTCSMPPCFGYRTPEMPTGVLHRSFEAMVLAYKSIKLAATNGAWYYRNCTPTSDTTMSCDQIVNEQYYGRDNNIQYSKESRQPDSATWYPATPQEVKDALYNNDPPPAIIDELSRYGNIIWPGPVTVSGPSEVKGPKKVSIGTDGNKSTTTTSQTTTPLSYDGPNVSTGSPTTTTTTVTTTTNPDGSTSTETATETTTTTPGDTGEAAPEEPPPTDSPLPELPKLYQRKYPEGMTGIWDARKAELMSSPLMNLKDSLLPDVGSGGACPSWNLPINVAWVDFGTYNVAPPCWIWDFGKVVIVLSAMFLARALIFGG